MVTKEIIDKRLNLIYKQSCREVAQIGSFTEWARLNWESEDVFHNLRVIIYAELANIKLIKDDILHRHVNSKHGQELYRELDELCTASNYRGIKV